MWEDAQLVRFWRKVDRTYGCWNWTGATQRGYGVVRIDKAYLRAHRVAWEWANGVPVPDGLYILHDCDNRLCVRPDHLRAGTASDNTIDMMRKGRHPWARGVPGNPTGTGITHARGTAVHKSHLTDQMVQAIRSRYADGETQQAIAHDIGINQTTVSTIVRRRTWTHI